MKSGPKRPRGFLHHLAREFWLWNLDSLSLVLSSFPVSHIFLGIMISCQPWLIYEVSFKIVV